MRASIAVASTDDSVANIQIQTSSCVTGEWRERCRQNGVVQAGHGPLGQTVSGGCGEQPCKRDRGARADGRCRDMLLCTHTQSTCRSFRLPPVLCSATRFSRRSATPKHCSTTTRRASGNSRKYGSAQVRVKTFSRTPAPMLLAAT